MIDTVLQDQPAIVLIAAAIITLLIIAFLLKKLFSSPSGDTILLVGPCNAGKTVMFLQLSNNYSTAKGTIASMQSNQTTTRLRNDKPSARPVKIVDIPGHPRLRREFDRYASHARGIVFVVDSVDFMPKKTEVAEQLFDVLTHPVVTGRSLPILLACNKADAGTKAHTVDFIRKRLEKELDQMRQTRGSLADQTDGSSSHNSSTTYNVLGNSPPGSFTFASLGAKGPLVTCVSVSAVDTGGVSDVEMFIRKCIPK